MENDSGMPRRSSRSAVHFVCGCGSILLPPLPLVLFVASAALFLLSRSLEEKRDALWIMLGSATAIGIIGLIMRTGLGDFGQ